MAWILTSLAVISWWVSVGLLLELSWWELEVWFG